MVEGSRPPAGWPLKGEVEFRNYSVRYRPGLELVLKNLSLRVRGGEKVRKGGGCAWHVVGTYGRAGVMPPQTPPHPLTASLTPSRWGSWAARGPANHP